MFWPSMKLLQEANSELNAYLVFSLFKTMVILAILGKPVADIVDFSLKNKAAATKNSA
jgi:hypothetical protein